MMSFTSVEACHFAFGSSVSGILISTHEMPVESVFDYFRANS